MRNTWTLSAGMLTGILLMVFGLASAPATSHAGSQATVTVDVVSGKKGSSGVDSSAKKHARLLSRVGGFGGWKLAKSLRLDVGEGKTVSQGVGKRSFSATLHSLSAEHARATFIVVDPAGKDHKVSSRLTNGASTIIVAETASGAGVQVFIIRVRY